MPKHTFYIHNSKLDILEISWTPFFRHFKIKHNNRMVCHVPFRKELKVGHSFLLRNELIVSAKLVKSEVQILIDGVPLHKSWKVTPATTIDRMNSKWSLSSLLSSSVRLLLAGDKEKKKQPL